MKNITIFFSCILIMLSNFLFSACDSTENWKKVEINNYGTIEVPENWMMETNDDGYIFFSIELDNTVKNVLVQYSDTLNRNQNKYFSKVEELVWLEDEYFSNGAGIKKYKVSYQGGSSVEIYAFIFTDETDEFNTTELFCTDSSISVELLKKIVKSYEFYA